MPKLLEVRANLSFGTYRASKVYEVDLEDDVVLALIGVGYLTATSSQGATGAEVNDDRGVERSAAIEAGGSGVRSDSSGADLRSVRVVGSPESEEVSDGDDPAEPSSHARHGTPVRPRRRKTVAGESVAGGEESR
jgi:hypothetical protein